MRLIKASELVTAWDSNSRERPAPETLTGLVDSIRAVGVVHPVGVRAARAPGATMVVYGFRRVEACRMIDPDYMVPTLDAGELGAWEPSEGQAQEDLRRALANLAENAGGRSDLSSWEVARKLVHIRELSKESTGKRPSGRELAKLAGVSDAVASRFLKVWAWCCEPGNEAMMTAWHNGTAFDQMLRACEAAQSRDDDGAAKRGRPKGSGKARSADDDDDDDDDESDEAKEALKWAKAWGRGIQWVQERLPEIDPKSAALFAAGAQWALSSISIKPRELPPGVAKHDKAPAKGK